MLQIFSLQNILKTIRQEKTKLKKESKVMNQFHGSQWSSQLGLQGLSNIGLPTIIQENDDDLDIQQLIQKRRAIKKVQKMLLPVQAPKKAKKPKRDRRRRKQKKKVEKIQVVKTNDQSPAKPDPFWLQPDCH